MTERTYFQLPINADEGFPQSFQLNFDNQVYQLMLYVNALETETQRPDDYIYNLPEADAYMVMQVAQQTPEGPQVIFQRKLVLNLEYEAAEVAFLFRSIKVSSPNGLLALEEIARRADAPLVVRDQQIFLGKAVGRDKGPDLPASITAATGGRSKLT